jgi:hypothetical protein
VFGREGAGKRCWFEGRRKCWNRLERERKMMSSLVCLWPGKRGKERRWFRWGERLRVSVSCCGEEKKKEKEGWLQENRARKAYFVPILSSLLSTV